MVQTNPPPQPQSFSRPKYRPDVDGMRALAILSVLIFHAFPNSLPGGFVGVDIFFVISGYLISSIIFRGLTLGSFSFFDFYARRVRRIFPAVTVVLLGSFVLGFFFLTPYALEDLVTESPYAAFFVENWRLFVTTGGYWETATELKPLMHFWSLGVEEQYYIFYPLICFLLWKVSAKRFLLSLIGMMLVSMVLCLYDTYNEPVRAFYSLHARFWELLIGGILAYVELQWPSYKNKLLPSLNFEAKNNILSVLGLGLILCSIAFFEEGKYFPGWRALLPTMGAVFIIAAGTGAYLNKYLFSNKSAVFIGLISYPLYLWHWPFLCIFRNNLSGENPTGWLAVSLIFCSFVTAYLTYALIERPMRSRKATWRIVIALIVILALVSLGLKTVLRKSENFQNMLYAGLPVAVQKTLKELPRSEAKDSLCTEMFGRGHSVCRSTSVNPHILVFGDSHNHIMWNYMYQKEHLPSLYIVGTGGSILFDKTAAVDSTGKLSVERMKLVEKVWNAIRSNDEIDTVVLRGYWLGHLRANLHSFNHPDLKGRELYKALWTDTLNELQTLNKKVIIVLDNVAAPFDPLTRCSKVERISLLDKNNDQCLIRYDELSQDDFWIRSYLKSLALKYSNVQIVDSWQKLCDESGCYLTKNDIPYYRDQNHLSVYGNGLVWELIESVLYKSEKLQ